MSDKNEKVYDALHTELAQRLLDMLRADPCDKCLRQGPGAKELTVIRQFLTDNNITAVARTKTPLYSLAEHMPFEDPEEQVARKKA